MVDLIFQAEWEIRLVWRQRRHLAEDHLELRDKLRCYTNQINLSWGDIHHTLSQVSSTHLKIQVYTKCRTITSRGLSAHLSTLSLLLQLLGPSSQLVRQEHLPRWCDLPQASVLHSMDKFPCLIIHLRHNRGHLLHYSRWKKRKAPSSYLKTVYIDKKTPRNLRQPTRSTLTSKRAASTKNDPRESTSVMHYDTK